MKKQRNEETVVLSEDLKRRIATADLSSLIDLLAGLIVKEHIRELTVSEDKNPI